VPDAGVCRDRTGEPGSFMMAEAIRLAAGGATKEAQSRRTPAASIRAQAAASEPPLSMPRQPPATTPTS